MTHQAEPTVWEHDQQHPTHIQQRADQKFDLQKNDPSHPLLRVKTLTDEL